MRSNEKALGRPRLGLPWCGQHVSYLRFQNFGQEWLCKDLTSGVFGSLELYAHVSHAEISRICQAPLLFQVKRLGHQQAEMDRTILGPQPLMRGEIGLRTKMEILPQEQAFNERLVLDGTFNVEQALFTGVSVQEKIDSLSRRAQGKPKNQEISEMLSYIGGGFNLRDGEIRFSALTFQVPGAAVHLKGSYGLDSEQIDLHGVARLQAKLSQTMTGWKRIALKPVDPFFSKAGAGTLLPIKVAGTREKPEFGLDRGAKQKTGEKTGAADRRLANY